MNVKGKKITSPSTGSRPKTDSESTQDREKKRAIFLMSWEPRRSAEGSVSSHPSIHHFCTHPKEPQLPAEMEILSRTTHAQPGMVRVKTSSHDIKVRINSGVVGQSASSVGQSSSRMDMDSWSESKSPASHLSLPTRKRKNSATVLASSSAAGDDFKSDDIIEMAKARLKKEERDAIRSKSPSKRQKSDFSGGESPRKRSSLKSRESRQSAMGSSKSVSPVKAERSVKFAGVDEDEIALTGTKMDVVHDPKRCVCTSYVCMYVHMYVHVMCMCMCMYTSYGLLEVVSKKKRSKNPKIEIQIRLKRQVVSGCYTCFTVHVIYMCMYILL